MIDPRQHAVLIRRGDNFQDETADISWYGPTRTGVAIRYASGPKIYNFRPDRVRVMQRTRQVVLPAECRVEINGEIWEKATEVVWFSASDCAIARVFYTKQSNERCATRRPEQVRVLTSATQYPAADEILRHWHDAARALKADDPLRRVYERLTFVHPESALATFVAGSPITRQQSAKPPIFPFRSNLSQRRAVENALTSNMSVIEGPPGTGKTETILNLIANIIVIEGGSVGVVSATNAAVDNVRDKLTELGFGHIIANLGREEKRADFFAAQADRKKQVDEFSDGAPRLPDPNDFIQVDQRLRRWQRAERTRAELRHELAAYRLELRHFDRHLGNDELPDLADLPLLHRAAGRILDYLAENAVLAAGRKPGLVRRIRRYFRFGALRGLDPDDTNVLMRLQHAFYDNKIAELDRELQQVESELQGARFNQMAADHARLSVQILYATLGERYRHNPPETFSEDTYKKRFQQFLSNHPVILSTCHSLRNCLPNGQLLDYLIIDEASQVDLLLAAAAMSVCRHLVVVGDRKQLPPVPRRIPVDLREPSPAYDHKTHLLASLEHLYGINIPRVLLREHYRCDPAIIGFCNKKFYDGELIPYTVSGAERPMVVVRTVEGNHMRQPNSGGRSNQREIDAIAEEVIAEHCPGIADEDIGVATPYRLQADKAAVVLDQNEVDTIHKYQGRQKDTVILSTVLDETWRGQTGLSFVDDPQMINVAVSRAIRRFILVTNHDMLPNSRHVSDLVGYIRYQNPGEEVIDSAVISMFDLLYKEYSARLQPLAARLKNEMKYRSEDIIWTVLHDIFAEPAYTHLAARNQVLLRHLLPADRSRLSPEQVAFLSRASSVDFVVYNRVTNQSLLAIEVDGFAYHENNPAQLRRDAIKDEILRVHQMQLLRLPTTGSGEGRRIRQALNDAEAHWARLASSEERT